MIFETEDERKKAVVVVAALILHATVNRLNNSTNTDAQMLVSNTFHIAEEFIKHAEQL